MGDLSFLCVFVPDLQSSGTDVYELVSAISTAVATVAALASTAMALWFYRDQKRAASVDRLSRYYDKMVATPIMEALDALKECTNDLTGSAAEEITKMCQVNASQPAVRTRVLKLIDDFEKELSRLRDIVTTVIGSWGDGECNNALRGEFEELEDSVKKEIAKLAMDQVGPDPRRVIVESTARFYAAILKHDPASKPTGRRRFLGLLKAK